MQRKDGEGWGRMQVLLQGSLLHWTTSLSNVPTGWVWKLFRQVDRIGPSLNTWMDIVIYYGKAERIEVSHFET